MNHNRLTKGTLCLMASLLSSLAFYYLLLRGDGFSSAWIHIYGFLCLSSLSVSMIFISIWLGIPEKRKHCMPLFVGLATLSFSVKTGLPLLQAAGLIPPRLALIYRIGASLAVSFFTLYFLIKLSSAHKLHPYPMGKTAVRILPALIAVVLLMSAFPRSLLSWILAGVCCIAAGTAPLLCSLWNVQNSVPHSIPILFGTVFHTTGMASVFLHSYRLPASGLPYSEDYGGLVLIICLCTAMVKHICHVVDERFRLAKHIQEDIDQKTRILDKSAKEREELISKFLHDMKSPAAFMLSYIQMMLCHDNAMEPALQQKLTVLERKCQDINSRIQEIQRFTVENPLDGPKEQIDLYRFLTEFHYFNKPDVEIDGQNFVLDLPSAEGCQVWANEGKLKRMLQNLIYNAVSFTPPGGTITLSLSFEKTDAVLRIQDTGKGMEPEVVDQIFNYRFTTRENEGGSGIGLYIVKSIVTEHGGTIAVTSKMGSGTTFFIRLPLLRDVE